MYVYAGIDEAGYGPMFGPLLVGRVVLGFEGVEPQAEPPDLWQHLARVVCRHGGRRSGRVLVDDSKKLYRKPGDLAHLEEGVLSFAALGEQRPASVEEWLQMLGDRRHGDLGALPWYAPSAAHPWQALPSALTGPTLSMASRMLGRGASEAGLSVLDLGAHVVWEDRFNELVAAMRSKASVNFTLVVKHLDTIWRRFGHLAPTVVVDRQSGRRHYGALLLQMFPIANLVELGQTDHESGYRLHSGSRRMTVRFAVSADSHHLPVALASMLSKYTRELLMARFQRWFACQAPHVKPTAGYARDAKRFWNQIQPVLAEKAIASHMLRRQS